MRNKRNAQGSRQSAAGILGRCCLEQCVGASRCGGLRRSFPPSCSAPAGNLLAGGDLFPECRTPAKPRGPEVTFWWDSLLRRKFSSPEENPILGFLYYSGFALELSLSPEMRNTFSLRSYGTSGTPLRALATRATTNR